MPKRIIDGEALWTSKKLKNLGACDSLAALLYCWLLPLADHNGVFEYDAALIWKEALFYLDIITQDELPGYLDLYQKGNMLSVFESNGKRWGYWVGIEKSGRLPSAKHAKRYKKIEYLIQDIVRSNSGVFRETSCTGVGSGIGIGIGSGVGLGPSIPGSSSSSTSIDMDEDSSLKHEPEKITRIDVDADNKQKPTNENGENGGSAPVEFANAIGADPTRIKGPDKFGWKLFEGWYIEAGRPTGKQLMAFIDEKLKWCKRESIHYPDVILLKLKDMQRAGPQKEFSSVKDIMPKYGQD